jgi:uncharacterized protein involved in outer membrane biogenesis
MAPRTYLKAAAAIVVAISIAMAAALYYLPRALNLDNYKKDILSLAEKSLHRRVSYQSASFSHDLVPCIVIRGITIAERSGDANLLEAGQVTFKVALFPLLRKEVRLQDLVVDRPALVLTRDRTGAFNFDDLLSGEPSRFKIHLDSIRLKRANIGFTDRFADPGGFTWSLRDLDLDVNGLARGETSSFRLSTTIADIGGPSVISASGTAGIPAQKKSLRDTKLAVRLDAGNLDASRYWPYYGRYLPFERVRGRVDLAADFRGKVNEFTSKGKVRIRGLRFNYPAVFHAVLEPKELRLAYELALTPRDLSATHLVLDVDRLHVTGSCLLRDIHSSDLRITARATTSPFVLEEFRGYIPYGVIVKSTADFIERHIKGGVYRLDDGRLDGRVSQITHMDRGANYNVLYIRGRVEKGLVSFPEVPSFNEIKGGLEMRGKDLLLRDMSGKFGDSPFTLEGRIAGYPLKTPVTYPFAMAMIPAKSEVRWLLRQKERPGMEFNGQSLLRLSGEGTAAAYRLAGSWDLTGADYSYREVIRKPAGSANRVSFSARLSEAEAELEELRYELASLDATGGARYRYNEREPLFISVQTNRFPVDPLVGMLPALQKYHLSGTVQARAGGAGNPADPGGRSWNGELTLADFSGRFGSRTKALHGINGTIRLRQGALETDGVSGSVGDSPFAVKGRVAPFAKPSADLELSSPSLHPEDVGFHSTTGAPALKNLTAALSLKDRVLKISSLTGQVNRTSFTLSGEVMGSKTPTASLHLDFPHLVVEDLTELSRLRPTGAKEGDLASATLKARITAAEGSFKDTQFRQLDSRLSLAGKRLNVEALRVGVFGGSVTGNGIADLAAHGGASYRAQYVMTRIGVAELLHAAGVQPYLNGVLTAQGDLSARGETLAELEKSARATAIVHLEQAELKRAAGGVPCSRLDATLALDQGSITVADVKASIFGGSVTGSGRFDFATDAEKKYQAHYRLERVDAAQLQRVAGVPEYLTGKMTAEGELTAAGNSPAALKNTATVATELDVSEGVARVGESRIPFRSLHSRLLWQQTALDVQKVRIETCGGVVTGDLKSDFATPALPSYRAKCQIAGVNAKEFFHLFNVTKEVSGTLNVRADLTARGGTAAELEKSLQGSAGLHLENGVINRYGILSKIFSILNVSQLLSFHLPDMVTTGMPYKRIDGNFVLRDGIASTSDLILASPSLNIRTVGKSDLVNKEIDLVIGVETLQTVNKVVSRIPIVGWLLSGGKRTFLVTYFRAKGSWDDAKVSAVPVSSLSEGFYNIFKRIYHLPEQMINKPGSVMMGQ